MKALIITLIVAVIAATLFGMSSCTPQRQGCHSTRGMSGY